MAAPQFFTPQRPASSQPARHFTLEQANSALPLVKRVVTDIIEMHRRATQCQHKLETSRGAEQQAVQQELAQSIDRLQDLIEELSDIGCELKDYRQGLIDFVGRHEGRDVYLCWKLGEEKIAFFHEKDAGFAGRKPIAQLREVE